MTAILRRGSKGAAVRDLQTQLNTLASSPSLRVDGVFGDATAKAVREFQLLFGLEPDQVVGPQTRVALKQAIAPIKPGLAEPDKAAMNEPVPRPDGSAVDVARAPPNVASLTLLDTARAIDEIIVHCTATPEGKDYTVADIRAWHKQRGFSDIGYHYVVYRDGRIMLGRPIGQQGAHCADAGKNRATIGVSYVGGLAANGKTAKDTRTAAQRSSLLWLNAELTRRHKVKRTTGHNRYAAKACPCFDVALDPLGRLAA